MKIALGTTSQSKKDILLDTLKLLDIQAEVKGYDVNSGITDQPLDEETTIKGAKNRAQNAFAKDTEAEIGIGMEGGVALIDENYFLVCVVAITTKENKIYLGISQKTQLPLEVSEEVKNGEELGIKIREYYEKHKGYKELDGLLEDLISRKKAFSIAIKEALRTYHCSDYIPMTKNN